MRIKKYRRKRRASSAVLRRSDGAVRGLADCVVDQAPRFQVSSEPAGETPQNEVKEEEQAERRLICVFIALGLLALLFFGTMTKPTTREQFLYWIRGMQSGRPELNMP